MVGGVTHLMLPHLSGVSHLCVNRPLNEYYKMYFISFVGDIVIKNLNCQPARPATARD